MEAKTTITALLIFLFLGLTGCGSLTKPLVTGLLPDLAILDDKVTSQGAEPLLDRDEFEKIDLIEELTSSSDAAADTSRIEELKVEIIKLQAKNEKLSGGTTPADKATIEELKAKIEVHKDRIKQLEENSDYDLLGNKQARKDLAKAFALFNKKSTQKRRTAIQERILAASNQRCDQFKNYLRQFQAEVNFGLGAITTTVAGLGAIFTPASTVRALSGAAAIASGVRAEFDENFFYTLATNVITEGIDTKREELYKKIRKRQNEKTEKYPIQAAVKDAVEYHGACSTIVGFEAASEYIQRIKNPGLKELKNVLDDQPGSVTVQTNETGESHVEIELN